MKRILISTLIAAAAMGLSLRAETKPLLNEQELPADAKNTLALADEPAAEDADAAAEETQDADALELLLADDALVELDEAAAPDELSTETMMREWIARYAAAARFAGIRSVKGTGGGLSSGGAVATAGADLTVSAAAPTPSVSVPAAGTVSLADTLTRASAAGVSLGSASASDPGTVSVATASSASGTSTILPAAFFSTRSVFSAVPAAAASYSLAGSSGVSAYAAGDDTTTNWAGGIDANTGRPLTNGFTTPSNNTASLTANSIVTFTTGNATTAIADVNTKGHSLQLNASGEKKLGLITGGGAVWLNSGRWHSNNTTTNVFAGAGDIYVLGTSQLQLSATQTIGNDVYIGLTTFSTDGDLSNSALRVGVYSSEVTATLSKLTILSEGAKIGFQNNATLSISNLTGSGDIMTGRYDGTNTLKITGATDYTGKITLVSGVTLNWTNKTATFGGLSSTAGRVAGGSYLNIKDAKAGSTFAGTVGSLTSGVTLNLTGLGRQAFTGTSYFSNVSVGSGATLDISSGTHTFGGTFTTGENTTLALGSVSANSAALSATGNVTLSQSTIFDIDSYIANAKLVSSSGTLSVDAGNLGAVNLSIGGFLVNQRGSSATFTVADNNTLVLSSYTAGGENYSLLWNGGDDGVWKANGSGWTKDADGATAANFQNGDSVTFSAETAGQTIRLSGPVSAGTVSVNDDHMFTFDRSAIFSASSITVAPEKTLSLSGVKAGTLTGTITLESGTLAIASPEATLASEGTIVLKQGATLDYGSSELANNVTRNLSAVKGTGTILYKTKNHATSGQDYGNNKVTLSNAFTGDFVIGETGAQWVMADGSNFGDSTIVLKGGSYFIAANANVELSNKIRFDGNAQIWADKSANRQFILNGDISGTGTFTKNGVGTVTLGGAATITTLTISGGSVEVTGSGVLTTTVTSMAANTSLTLAGTGATKSAVTISGEVGGKSGNTVTNATIKISGGNSVTYTNTVGQKLKANIYVSGEGSIFTQNGINGSDQLNYEGTTKGVISVKDDGTLALGSNRWTINGIYTLSLDGGNITGSSQQDSNNASKKYGNLDFNADHTIGVGNSFGKDSNISASVRLRGNVTFNVAADVALNITGKIVNAEGNNYSGKKIIKSGAGTLTLDIREYGADENVPSESFTGGIDVQAGKVIVKNASALGSGTLTAAGSTGVNEVTLRVGETGAAAALTLENNISVSAGKTLILESANAGNKLRGNITGASGALKLASGTLTLTGTNTYTGGTTIENGTLVAGSADALGSGPVSIGSDATLKIGVGEITINGLSGAAKTETAAASKIALANGTESATVTLNISGDDSYSGYFDGAISLVKTGAGTLVLTGNNLAGDWGGENTFSGTVEIREGTIKTNSTGWGSKGSLGKNFTYSGIQLNGGVLEVTAAQTADEQGGYGTGGALRGFSVAAGTGTYRYTANEDSRIAHNAANQFIGLADDATLIFDVVQANATLTVTKVIAKNEGSSATTETSGTIVKTGEGTLVLKPNDGANNFTGSVTIAEGKLVAGSANALGTGADTNVVKIAGGQLAIADGVTLAQKNVEIALGEAYKTTNGAAAVAAISGADKLASGTTITLSLENEAMNVAAEAAQDSYKIYDGTLADGVTIKLSDSLARLWKLEAVAGQDGVYALVAIPEPSLFGLLAGVTALGFSMSSRRRRKKQ